MINNSLDDIIKCNIDISNPTTTDTDVDEKVIVVAPKNDEITSVLTVTSTKELLSSNIEKASDTYKVVNAAFEQTPSLAELYVVFLNDDETIVDALKRAATEVEFYGIYAQPAISAIETADDIPTTIKAIADYAEENEKLFGFEISSENALEYSIFSGDDTYYRTFAVYVAEIGTALAIMSKCFGYDPGSETWALQELEGLDVSSLTSTQKTALDSKNVNTFLKYAGSNVTIGGKVISGEWIDVIRFRDWLKKKMQKSIFAILKANKKVPYNDAGISLIAGAINSVLAEGQTVGGIDDNVYDSDGNVTYAYQVTVPKASELTEAERKSRKLSKCTYTARLSGAIHVVEIKGYLTF